MIELKRKIDGFLTEWKSRPGHKPLIVKGARQIGKTHSINHFAAANYANVVAINFILQSEFRRIFDDGYDVDAILKNITFISPETTIEPGRTLIFFDELQACPAAATSLKAFCLDGRYDVVCSGSLMGINYHEIESNAVGHKEDYEMFSLDFEEFLWAKGYSEATIDGLRQRLFSLEPLSSVEFGVLSDIFKDYMVVGGMPEVVHNYIAQGNFSGTLSLQRQLLLDYEEDITKYAVGLDKGKILNVYRHISTALGRVNKKFQMTRVAPHARSRDYVGVIDWLASAGIVNVCYCLNTLELPLKGNYNPEMFKLYYQDSGLLVASLDEEAQTDLRVNQNFSTYKGALFENVVADMLRKAGYGLYYYRNEKSTLEMDFFVRTAGSLVPVEVKATDGASRSLQKLTDGKGSDIKFGIKLCHKNIGFNGHFYTIPYFLTFALRDLLRRL